MKLWNLPKTFELLKYPSAEPIYSKYPLTTSSSWIVWGKHELLNFPLLRLCCQTRASPRPGKLAGARPLFPSLLHTLFLGFGFSWIVSSLLRSGCSCVWCWVGESSPARFLLPEHDPLSSSEPKPQQPLAPAGVTLNLCHGHLQLGVLSRDRFVFDGFLLWALD